MRTVSAALAAVVGVCLLSLPAQAGIIHSKAGAVAYVANAFTAKFQALVNDLEEHGAVIKFMGGVRRGYCGQGSKHPCGMALDVCQYARSVVDSRCHLPGAATENKIAAAHGLFHGAQWCYSDRGHFEAGGSAACGHGWNVAHATHHWRGRELSHYAARTFIHHRHYARSHGYGTQQVAYSYGYGSGQ